MKSLNILLVRTDRLGDVVLTLPMVRAIHGAMPDAVVTVLASGYTQPIIEQTAGVGAVATLQPTGTRSLFSRIWRISRQLVQLRPDAIFFPGPRFELVLAALVARVPLRIGTGYRWYSFLLNRRIYEHRKTAKRHETEFNLRMLRAIGIDADPDTLPEIHIPPEATSAVQSWRDQVMPGQRYIVLHTTSSGSSHEWPAAYFIELGQRLKASTGFAIVLTGTPVEEPRLRPIAAALDAPLFCGKSLLELSALLAGASCVVAGGTGPGHLSAALGAPTVGLFPLPLAISKERWGFRGKHVISLAPPPVPGCPDCQHCTCMERISPGRVEMEVRTIARLSDDTRPE